MIYCPKCNGRADTMRSVDDRRQNTVTRTRECEDCGYRFKTVERVEFRRETEAKRE